jgi:hypothetical protein
MCDAGARSKHADGEYAKLVRELLVEAGKLLDRVQLILYGRASLNNAIGSNQSVKW